MYQSGKCHLILITTKHIQCYINIGIQWFLLTSYIVKVLIIKFKKCLMCFIFFCVVGSPKLVRLDLFDSLHLHNQSYQGVSLGKGIHKSSPGVIFTGKGTILFFGSIHVLFMYKKTLELFVLIVLNLRVFRRLPGDHGVERLGRQYPSSSFRSWSK